MFGDQDLFCRRSDFERLGGFNNRLPIMEDLDLIMRLHAAGPSLSNLGTDQEPPSTQASVSESSAPSGDRSHKLAPLHYIEDKKNFSQMLSNVWLSG